MMDEIGPAHSLFRCYSALFGTEFTSTRENNITVLIEWAKKYVWCTFTHVAFDFVVVVLNEHLQVF
jgi:hypothetical protein